MPTAPLTPEIVACMLQLLTDDEQPPVSQLAKRVLSIHDHWLSEAEAAHEMVSFATFGSLEEYRYYLLEEDKFVRLLSLLHRNSDVYFVEYEYDEPKVLPAEKLSHVLGRATVGLREQKRCIFYISRYQLILTSAFDLNMPAYFFDPQQAQAFADWARAYGLFLL